jgi:nicotinate phosphoribosyltransferase
MRIAAGDRYLAEMGARRANENAAVAASRAAYIAGFDASSNLEAHRSFGVPSMGTSAHSFTLLYETEQDAFAAQLASMGNDTTLLVDTYDIEKAVRSAVELSEGKVAAVRIDSGDLASTAFKVRSLLDSLGAKSTRIVVTSDLDEYTIAALQAAPVDAYGVGTSLVTGSSHPTAGFVYKLVSHQSQSGWVSVEKLSENKSSKGGKKTASRLIENSVARSEMIGTPTQGRPLQVKLMDKGLPVDVLSAHDRVIAAREHHKAVMRELPDAGRRLSQGDPVIPTIVG